ncbi:MAG: hypothetical protein K8R57_11115 [Verrucomicrobia bacterium]|nr:hypothetical protein [Verrucomicrobiota bacterium]
MKIPKKIVLVKHEYPAVEQLQDIIEQVLVSSQKHEQDSNDNAGKEFFITGKPLEALMAIITYVWRIQDRIIDKHTMDAKESISVEELKKLSKYTEQIIDKLKSMGFEIKDRLGEQFNYGLPENVVATKPQPGLTHETVIETLMPTIYFQNKTIQRGEIVIATPETPKAE